MFDKEDDDETLEILMTDLDVHNAKQFYLDHASAVAEGQYYERAHRARKEAREALGALSDHVDDLVDVFDNSESGSGTASLTFPQELTNEGHALGTVVAESCGLSNIYRKDEYWDSRIDAYLFTPCGFSANGVIPATNGPCSSHYFTVHVTPESHCSYASFETNVPNRQSCHESASITEQVISIFKPGHFTVTLFKAKTQFGDYFEENYDEAKQRAIAKHKDRCCARVQKG